MASGRLGAVGCDAARLRGGLFSHTRRIRYIRNPSDLSRGVRSGVGRRKRLPYFGAEDLAWLFQKGAVVFGVEAVAFRLAGGAGRRAASRACFAPRRPMTVSTPTRFLPSSSAMDSARARNSASVVSRTGRASLGHHQIQEIFGCVVPIHLVAIAPGMTRTCDLLVRSQTLYPTELRARQ